MAARESEFSPEQREVIDEYPLLKALVNPEVVLGPSQDIRRWTESIAIHKDPLRESLVRRMGYAPYAVFLHGFTIDKTCEGLFSDGVEALPDSRMIMKAFIVETILLIGYQIHDAKKLDRVAIPIFEKLSRLGYFRQTEDEGDALQRTNTFNCFSGLLVAGVSLTLLDHFEESWRQQAENDSNLTVFRDFVNIELNDPLTPE